MMGKMEECNEVTRGSLQGYLMTQTAPKVATFSGKLFANGIVNAPKQTIPIDELGLHEKLAGLNNERIQICSVKEAEIRNADDSESMDVVDAAVQDELNFFAKMKPKPAAMIFNYLKKTSNVVIFDGVPFLFEPAMGIYSALATGCEEVLLRNLPEEISAKVLTSNLSDVGKRFQAFKRDFPQMSWMKNPCIEKYIKFRNGVVDVMTGQIVETDPREMSPYLMTHEINASYSPEEKGCPQFDSFLRTSFAGCEDEIPLVWAMIGIAISNIRSFKTAFFLYGQHDSGKSILAKVMAGLVGDDYISALRLEDFNGNFRAAALIGSYLNIGAEVSSGKMGSVSEFKALVSGGTDLLDVNIKHRGSQKLENRALMVFPMNRLPIMPDGEDADSIFSRIKLISMPNTIPVEDRILDLEYILKSEYDAIAYQAVQALRDVVRNGLLLPQSKTSDREMETFCANYCVKDPMAKFVNEKLVFDVNGIIAISDLKREFSKYCSANALVPNEPKSWEKTLCQYLGKTVRRKNFTVKKHNDTAGILGVAYKTEMSA